MTRYELSFIAPIPVGHRVELTFLKKPLIGWFSSVIAGYEDMLDKPIVRDMETGVVYASTNVYTEHDYVTPRGASPLPDHHRPELEQDHVVIGRVVSCRVISYQPGYASDRDTTHIQTTLVLEPVAEKGFYR